MIRNGCTDAEIRILPAACFIPALISHHCGHAVLRVIPLHPPSPSHHQPGTPTRQWPDLLPLQDRHGASGPVPHWHHWRGGCMSDKYKIIAATKNVLTLDCWCSEADLCSPASPPGCGVRCHDSCKLCNVWLNICKLTQHRSTQMTS